MASFDFGSVSAYKFALATAVTATTNTAAIDTKGFQGVAVVASVSLSNLNTGTQTIAMSFREGDDTNVTNSTALDSKYIITNPTMTASNTSFWASVVPAKRYLFATLTPESAVNANVSVLGALGFGADLPTQ